MKGRTLKYITNQTEILRDPEAINEIRENISQGDVYIAKNVIDADFLKKVRKYLTQIGSCSLPNYKAIDVGCPNFHRINNWDERAYVMACFHQFVFFPWNQDVFNLFKKTEDVYFMKNLLSNIPANKYLGIHPEDGCTSRLAFQFYPSGIGGLNKHQDPVDSHQLTVPTLTMSQKGIDFQTGGAYVEMSSGEKLCFDDICEIGDVSYFNASTPHGVDIIDEGEEVDWLSFKGRWMLLFAINKLQQNTSIADSVDLEK